MLRNAFERKPLLGTFSMQLRMEVRAMPHDFPHPQIQMCTRQATRFPSTHGGACEVCTMRCVNRIEPHDYCPESTGTLELHPHLEGGLQHSVSRTGSCPALLQHTRPRQKPYAKVSSLLVRRCNPQRSKRACPFAEQRKRHTCIEQLLVSRLKLCGQNRYLFFKCFHLQHESLSCEGFADRNPRNSPTRH